MRVNQIGTTLGLWVDRLKRRLDLLDMLMASRSDKGISDGRHLLVGFASVTCLLLIVGIAGVMITNQQNHSFDRFSAAGEVLELMDEARLSELIFTRDETTEAANRTEDVIDQVLAHVRLLEDAVSDETRKARLREAMAAISNYKSLFHDFVALRRENRAAREAMVQAAIQASNSANNLQYIQEKYIRLDTESVRGLRQQVEEISENTANSYEIVIFVEEALEHEKNFLLSGNLRDLEHVRSSISGLTTIINQLKDRIEDPQSLELLTRINTQKDRYLEALEKLESSVNQLTRFELSSPKVMALDRAAFVMRDTAFALRSNERSVLADVQVKVADMQELMARRLALSEEVNQILTRVGEARQIDRDFLLAQTDEARRVLATRVMTLLGHVVGQVNKIQTLLIEEDEKEAFEDVLPSVTLYRENFTQTTTVALKTSETGRRMVDAALEADRLLNLAQSSRMDDIETSREWAKVLGPIGFLFAIGIILLAFFMRQAQRNLSSAYGIISGSIDYASNIQRSILPREEQFTSSFKEHFIVWEPRDRVGGDIYWHHKWGNGTLVVLADCTGHGVPGAFMSIIATSALENALDEVPIGDTGGLLKRMHQRVQTTLRQGEPTGTSDDGLELGAIYLEPGRKALIFAGARFSCFYIDPAAKEEAVEVKGDRSGIGFRAIPSDQVFRNRTIEVIPNRAFYLTSDGMIDQVGGPRRRSYGKKRFRDLIRTIGKTPMSEQKHLILKELQAYQGRETRRDDLSVIGIVVD